MRSDAYHTHGLCGAASSLGHGGQRACQYRVRGGQPLLHFTQVDSGGGTSQAEQTCFLGMLAHTLQRQAKATGHHFCLLQQLLWPVVARVPALRTAELSGASHAIKQWSMVDAIHVTSTSLLFRMLPVRCVCLFKIMKGRQAGPQGLPLQCLTLSLSQKPWYHYTRRGCSQKQAAWYQGYRGFYSNILLAPLCRWKGGKRAPRLWCMKYLHILLVHMMQYCHKQGCFSALAYVGLCPA